MPPDGAEFTGRVATVSGWGRLKYGGGVPSVLQEVQVSVTARFKYIMLVSINLLYDVYKVKAQTPIKKLSWRNLKSAA